MTADVLALVLVSALFLAAGVGVCAAAGWWRDHGVGPWSIGLAYVVGVAAYGVLAQLLYVLGAPLSRWQVVVVCAALAAPAVLLRRRSARPPARRPPLATPLLALLVFALGLLAVDLWFQPLWSYDAWTLWTPKALALAELDGLDAAWFTSAGVIWPDYPLLLAAIEAATFEFAGYAPGVLDLQSWLLLVGLVVAFADVVARRVPGLVAAAAAATLVLAPTVASQLAGAVADVPLAAQFALGAVLLLVWIDEPRRSTLVVAAVLLAGAAATKVEGLSFAVAAVVGLCVAEALRRRFPARAVAVLTGALAVSVVPWRAWLAWQDVQPQASLSRVVDVELLREQAAYLPEVLAFVGARALDPRQWLLALPLAAVALVVAARRGDRVAVAFVLATAGLGFAALLLAYWTTPFDLDYHLQTSARRVITPLLFFLLVSAPLLASRRRAPATLVP